MVINQAIQSKMEHGVLSEKPISARDQAKSKEASVGQVMPDELPRWKECQDRSVCLPCIIAVPSQPLAQHS